eukprot:142332-Pelagomonas_calceolata.AAC.2
MQLSPYSSHPPPALQRCQCLGPHQSKQTVVLAGDLLTEGVSYNHRFDLRPHKRGPAHATFGTEKGPAAAAITAFLRQQRDVMYISCRSCCNCVSAFPIARGQKRGLP